MKKRVSNLLPYFFFIIFQYYQRNALVGGLTPPQNRNVKQYSWVLYRRSIWLLSYYSIFFYIFYPISLFPNMPAPMRWRAASRRPKTEMQNNRACPQTRLVLCKALGKANKSPLFPINIRRLSQELKLWDSLNIFKFCSGAAAWLLSCCLILLGITYYDLIFYTFIRFFVA